MTSILMRPVFIASLFAIAQPLLAEDVPNLSESVTIEFPMAGYHFTRAEAAKTVTIEYRIVVARDIPGVKALAFAPSCAQPAGPSGLHPRERIAGNNQSYCVEDFGLAPPCMGKIKVLKKGVYKHSFAWDGRNWNGPSDTDNRKGKPFPAGTYDLTVDIHGHLVTDEGTSKYEIQGKTKLVMD